MKNFTMTLLAAAAIGAVSIGGASAMPFNDMSAALGESHVQDVRVVCDRHGRCYNTARANRRARTYYSPSYYNPGYYRGPGYGYYGGPRVGIGVGPLGVGIW
jgi:hypothetical protein